MVMVIFTRSVTKWAFIRDICILFSIYIFGVVAMPRLLFLSALNGMLLSIAVLTCFLYAPSTIQFHQIGQTRTAMMRCGIVGAWLVVAIQAGLRIYFIEFHPGVTGRSFDVTVGTPAIALTTFAAMHIISIGMEQNRPERRYQCLVFWSLIFGGAAVLALHGIMALA